MAANEDRTTDFGAELTLEEAAALLDVHGATARRYIREGKLPAHKVEGPHGREWRIWQADAEALAKGLPTVSGDLRQRDSSSEAAVSIAIAQIESTVRTDLLEVREGVEAGLRRLSEEQEHRAARVLRGLMENPKIIRDLAAQVGTLTAELEASRAECDRLRDELEAERGRGWWQRIFTRAN